MPQASSPDVMPVLSRGKHRNAKKGACFMELASYLAGEKWSDHPACTHPLLAAMARDVNDHVGDRTRRRLAPLIPDVIGLTSDDPRTYAWIARDAALAALPIAAAERQRVSAVGLLRCERVLNELEGRPSKEMSASVATALDGVPLARDWARGFTALGWGSSHSFCRRSAPAIVHTSVAGIATAPVDDPEGRLVALLGDTIAAARAWSGHEAESVSADQWREVTALTRR